MWKLKEKDPKKELELRKNGEHKLEEASAQLTRLYYNLKKLQKL